MRKHMRKNDKAEKRKAPGRKHMLWIVVAIVLTLVIIVSGIASINVKAMNSCIDTVLEELEKHYTLTPRDAGEYKKMKLFNLKLHQSEQLHLFIFPGITRRQGIMFL